LVNYKGWLIGLALSLSLPALAQEEVAYEVSSLTPYEAFEQGRLLRSQFKNSEARAYLKYAADKGNADAAYLYAIDISKYNANSRTPAEAREYVESAARLGSLDAMMYLAENGDWLRPHLRQSWKKQYHDGLILLAKRYPAQAMYGLARYYEVSDAVQSQYYLDKSVSYDYPQALMEQAKRYMGGIETITPATVTDPRVLESYLKAAKQDFLPGVRACIEVYEAKSNYQEAMFWRTKALELGDITSLAVMAKIYASKAPSYHFIEKNLPKAHAYAEMYLDNAGSDRLANLHSMMEQFFIDTTNKMTPQEIDESKTISASYQSSVVFYNHDPYWDL
jgi:TPR repeat protein